MLDLALFLVSIHSSSLAEHIATRETHIPIEKDTPRVDNRITSVRTERQLRRVSFSKGWEEEIEKVVEGRGSYDDISKIRSRSRP